MESKTHLPSFTVSLRGYDRVEVDEYLDSLAEALTQVDDLQEQNRRLQAHIMRQSARIKDLEEHINSDTPKTGAILGERISILLRSAEETAADTISRAEEMAADTIARSQREATAAVTEASEAAGRLKTEAEQKMAEAEETAQSTVARGEEQARRIEAAARAEAAEIISEAEARATARTRQIEQWAEQVVSHTRAEDARMRREQQERRDAANAELRALGETRDSAAATLNELRDMLGRALGLIATAPPAAVGSPDAGGAPRGAVVGETEDDAVVAEMPWPATAGVDGLDSGLDAETDGGVDAGAAPDVEAGADVEGGGPAADVAGAGEEPSVGADADAEDAHAGDAHDGEPIRTVVIDAGDDAATDDGQASGVEAAGAVALDEHVERGDDRPVRLYDDADTTGEIDVRDLGVRDPGGRDLAAPSGEEPADEEFEAKLEAWVSNKVPAEGPRHFKRS